MAVGSDFISKITPNVGGGFMNMVISIFLSATILSLCGLGLWWFIKKRKHWNLKVEFRLPRGIQEINDKDGNKVITGTIKKEWGKGYYNAKEGVVYVKRKKQAPIPMKPFNIKEFLSESNILTVIQVGIEDYRPILEDSYLNVIDYDTGEEAALLKAKIDTSESKSWRNTYERERKASFTMGSWLREHGQLLGFGFIIVCIFVGFAIVYSKIGG